MAMTGFNKFLLSLGLASVASGIFNTARFGSFHPLVVVAGMLDPICLLVGFILFRVLIGAFTSQAPQSVTRNAVAFETMIPRVRKLEDSNRRQSCGSLRAKWSE
jgi:hypothetical protein